MTAQPRHGSPRLGAAPLGPRFAAATLNTVVPGIAALVVWGAVQHPPSAVRSVLFGAITVVLLADTVRQLWTLSRWGWSSGLAAFRLSVRGEDDWRPIGWRRALGRQSLFVLLSVTGVGWLANVALARRDEQHRMLHDRAVRGVVVRDEPPAASVSVEASAAGTGTAVVDLADGGPTAQADEARWEVRTGDGAVIEVTGLALVGRGSNGADDEPPQVIPVAGEAEMASWSQLALEVDGTELRVHDLGWANKALVVSLSGSVRRLKPFAGIALSDGDTIFFKGGHVQVRRVPAPGE